MRTLIIATNTTDPGVETEIKAGLHHRVDYLELGQMPDHDYMDYNSVPDRPFLRWVENILRQDMRQAIQVAETVRSKGYQQVFSMSERVGIPLAMLLPKNVRHIVQFAHGLSGVKLSAVQALNLEKRWHTVIAPTRAEAAVLRLAFGKNNPGRVRMMYYAVDTGFYDGGKTPVPVSQTDHFESLGLSYRDYPTLVKAMRYLPEIPCQIRSGSTWYAHRALLGNGQKPKNISLVPFVSPAELRGCYLQSRFSVVPLKLTTQWSAGCTTVMQAQSMGRAVIATRTPGMQEYIQDGETGILVAPGNARDLADAIAYLWENPQVAEEMGQKASARARAVFSIDKWMDEIMRVLCSE